jgi:hypothetical protein
VGASIAATDNRLLELSTTSRRWTTRRGARVGQRASRVQGLYGQRLTRERTCDIGGFGAELDVLVLRGRRRTTAFELQRGRVRTIWVLAERLSRRSCDPQPRITPTGVGEVRLGRTFRALRRAGLVGPLRPGCELAGPDARYASLRAPLRGLVDFTQTTPRRVASISVTGGATARGVAVGDDSQDVRDAYPRARFEEVLGWTVATVPRSGRAGLQFLIDRQTLRVETIGIPFIAFCE